MGFMNKNNLLRLIEFVRVHRAFYKIILLLADLIIVLVSFFAALYLRLGDIPSIQVQHLIYASVSALIIVCVYWFVGLYDQPLRFSPLTVQSKTMLASIANTAFFTIIPFVIVFQGIPRTVGLIFILTSIGLILGYRHLIHFGLARIKSNFVCVTHKVSTALVFVGVIDQNILRSAISNGDDKVSVILVDDLTLVGRSIMGIPIAPTENISHTLDQFNVKKVVFPRRAIPSVTLSEIRNYAEVNPIELVDLPVLAGLASMAGPVEEDIVFSERFNRLVDRSERSLSHQAAYDPLSTRTILVTGGGGSIGTELCSYLVHQSVKSLIIVDSNELALHTLRGILKRIQPKATHIFYYLGSVTDEPLVREIFNNHAPNIVYHAAAYKHVSIVQDNFLTGTYNNVAAVYVVAKMAKEMGSEKFVLVSTDKAVRPSNYMGASKRLSEILTYSFQATSTRTAYSIVRFGNVLGSSGSVVKIFEDQIMRGGPLTVTDPEVERYFMSIPEAARLTVLSSLISAGGEIFVLDMGEPVNILNLAKKMIEMHRGHPSMSRHSIDIEFVGLQPGEKLKEELSWSGDLLPTSIDGVLLSEERNFFKSTLLSDIDNFLAILRTREEGSAREMIEKYVGVGS